VVETQRRFSVSDPKIDAASDPDQVMRRGGSGQGTGQEPATLEMSSHRLEGDEIPLRTPGKKDKPLRNVGFGGPTETKKPGPSLL